MADKKKTATAGNDGITALLERWLGATELLDQTVTIVQQEIHDITELQSRLSDDIITHVKALGGHNDDDAKHVNAVITATQMEDQARQRQEHIVMALETIADALKTLREETVAVAPGLSNNENFRRQWSETLVERQNMEVVRQRFAKALLGEECADKAPSDDDEIELF